MCSFLFLRCWRSAWCTASSVFVLLHSHYLPVFLIHVAVHHVTKSTTCGRVFNIQVISWELLKQPQLLGHGNLAVLDNCGRTTTWIWFTFWNFCKFRKYSHEEARNILAMAVVIHCAWNRVFLDCIRYVNIEMFKKVKLFLSMLWRSVGIAPLILNLDIKRRYVVRFNPRWLCPWQRISGNSNMMLQFFCSVWVWNVVCHPQRGTLFEHVWV